MFSPISCHTQIQYNHNFYCRCKGIKSPLLPIADTDILSNISDSEEEKDQHNSDIKPTLQRDLDPNPASTSFQQPKWAQLLIETAKNGVGDPDDKNTKVSISKRECCIVPHISTSL